MTLEASSKRPRDARQHRQRNERGNGPKAALNEPYASSAGSGASRKQDHLKRRRQGTIRLSVPAKSRGGVRFEGPARPA